MPHGREKSGNQEKSGKTNTNDKSNEKSGKNGGLKKSQEKIKKKTSDFVSSILQNSLYLNTFNW